MDNKSIAHTRWNCTYHIVFIPKCRRRIMYGETKRDLIEIIKKLCEMKQVEYECIRFYVVSERKSDVDVV